MQKVIKFEKAGTMPSKHYKIAYVTECVTNAYCEARMKGLNEASKKYGFGCRHTARRGSDPQIKTRCGYKRVHNVGLVSEWPLKIAPPALTERAPQLLVDRHLHSRRTPIV